LRLAKNEDAHARDELGINPEELGGSAGEAAITSFLLFALGAIVPVIPFLFLSGTTAIVVSAALSAAALFAIGAAITLFTGRSTLFRHTPGVFWSGRSSSGLPDRACNRREYNWIIILKKERDRKNASGKLKRHFSGDPERGMLLF
jgi:hypothetical protein